MRGVTFPLMVSAAALLALSQPAQAQLARGTVQPDRLDNAPKAPRAERKAATPKANVDVAAPAVAAGPVSGVRFEGSSLPKATLDAAVRSFIGAAIDAVRLQAIAEAISAAYAKSQVALYSILVPQQDFANGLVRIVAVENSVEEVVLAGEGAGKAPLTRSYAAEMGKERPLTRQTLERFLLLIDDIPGVSITPMVLEGSRPNTVKLAIERARKPVETVISIDSRGASSLGRTQLRGDVYLNGWGYEGNQTRLTVAGSSDFKKYRSASAGHTATFGPSGVSVSGSLGWFSTRPSDAMKGEGYAAGLQVSYPLIRSSKLNVSMAGGIDGVNSDNASFGQIISSDRTRALRGALTGSGVKGKTSWSASGSISQGLDAFGARVNAFLATPHFTKANLQASVSQPIGASWRIDAAAAGQVTQDALPAAELITFGGARFGRAFGNDALAGDSGLGGSLEVTRVLSGNHPLKGSEVYGFVDGGTVWTNDRAGGILQGTEADLASAGAGVRVRVGKRTMLGIEAANTVDTIGPGDEDKWRVGFSLQSAF